MSEFEKFLRKYRQDNHNSYPCEETVWDHQQKRIDELEARIHEAYEIYAGSEGFKPQTAPEDYLQNLVYEMASTLKPPRLTPN